MAEALAKRTDPALEPYGRLSGSDDNWEGLLTTALRAGLAGDVSSIHMGMGAGSLRRMFHGAT